MVARSDPETEQNYREIQIADSLKFGDVTINDGGTGKATGVAKSDIAKGSTEVVNGGQAHSPIQESK